MAIGIFLGLFMFPGCQQTKFEQPLDVPSGFRLIDFIFGFSSPLHIKGYFTSQSANNGTDCAKVTGMIEWGDGAKEAFDSISPCVSINKAANWSSAYFEHSYPSVGTYALSAVFTAHYTNGSVTASLNKNINVDQ
jgi:hypothetical protein